MKIDLNKISIGSWITLGHFSIAEIMSQAKFDWLCIDMEHSVIDFFQAEQLIVSIEANNCIPFVRVGQNDPLLIKRALDAGAKGLILPMINSLSDAEMAVNSVKYPPVGKRGVGLARAQGYGFNFDQYAKIVNKETMVIAQIEHINAINNLDEILSLNGIDGTIIGPYDLSASMGKPGKYEDSDVLEAIKRYEEISKKFGKSMGYHVIEPDYRLALEKIKDGYTFIAFSLDTLFLGTICRQQINELKSHIK